MSLFDPLHGFLEFFDLEASQVIRPLPVVGHNLFR